ncbi:MAG: hypothetical protein NTY68_00790 [Candidatus Micrarchaeota archaeon]|nr:hypothetical protein [Candidatus Micrarchaeota archaeon]
MNHALRFARRTGAIALCAAALCISCSNKAALKQGLEEYKAGPDTVSIEPIPKDTAVSNEPSDRFEVKTPKYTYVGYVDYKRVAQQAAGSFRNFVKYGADSSRNRFMVSLDMLVDGKNCLKQQANIDYLMKDPAYCEIRTEFRKARPDGDVEDFLDAIDHVRMVGNSDSLRKAYGDGFVDAVLKYGK